MLSAMDAAAATSSFLLTSTRLVIKRNPSRHKIIGNYSEYPSIRDRKQATKISAMNEVSSGVTWQIVVGSIAGVTPFVVAGIEFSKRIIAQRRCEECGGSGLVVREKQYFRCPQCGFVDISEIDARTPISVCLPHQDNISHPRIMNLPDVTSFQQLYDLLPYGFLLFRSMLPPFLCYRTTYI